MKKSVLSSLFFLFAALVAFADDFPFSPTDTWPYIYENFTNGVIHFEAPYADLEAEINICVADGHLHYIENGVILESVTKGVLSAEVNGKLYSCFNGQMMEVLAENENGYVGNLSIFDPTQAGKADLGYGISSSNYAAGGVDLSTALGLGTEFIHTKIAEIVMNKDRGTALPIATTTYIVVGKTRIEAQKVYFQDLVGKEKASAFLKANKVKWSSPETLLPVADFIAENN